MSKESQNLRLHLFFRKGNMKPSGCNGVMRDACCRLVCMIRTLKLRRGSHLCCHDKTGGGRVDGNVTSHQSHVLELFIHLSVLLVREGFDGAGEDDPLLLSKSQSDGIPTGGENKLDTSHKNVIPDFFMHGHRSNFLPLIKNNKGPS